MTSSVSRTGPAPRAGGSAAAVAAGLADAPAALELPADHARPGSLGPETASVDLPLAPDVVEAVERFAAGADTDVDAVLLAAWLVALRRLTDETDLVVGCAGLTPPTREGELLVLRREVSDVDGFGDVVRGTGADLAALSAQGPVTLPEVLAALRAEPGPGKHPVFQVGFARVDQPGQRPFLSRGWAPPDAALVWWSGDDGLHARLDYAPELFTGPRAERLAAELVRLLAAGLVEPAQPVWSLPLLSEQDQRLLGAWTATPPTGATAVTVAETVLATARARPDAPAVEHHGQVLSYDQLLRRAAGVAEALSSRGVGPDVAVAVLADRSFDLVVGVLGVLLAGGAYVPVDPAYPAARQQLMIESSGCRVVLTQQPLLPVVPEVPGAEVLVLDALPEAVAPERVDTDPARADDLVYVIYTSGSTGTPKGVSLPNRSLTNLLAWQQRRPQAVPAARTLQFSSISFDVSFQEVFSTWSTGGTLVLVDDATRRDPRSLLAYLVEQRITRLFLPYVALRGLASACAATGVVPATLREVYTAGEQLQADPTLRSLFRALPECTLENQYGPSESHVVTAWTLEPDPESWPALPPIGRPIDASSVRVLDARQQDRPVGVPGELYLGGVCLARGYLGRPDLTDERFVELVDPRTGQPARWYRSGDLGRWTDDGVLEYLGRADEQVKFRGYRIEPGEVAAVLAGAPGVRECVVVVRASGDAGARLTAYLVPSGSDGVDVGAVHALARERLPSHLVPTHYLEVATLPLTPSGKVDTRALPDADFDRQVLTSAYRAPADATERVLCEIWQQILAVPEVGVDDDWFELGGDSLGGAEMVQQVADRLGVELPLGALAQGPTVGQLAAVLRSPADPATTRSLVPLRATGSRTPLFVVHGGSGNVASFPRLARALPDDQPVYALQWNGFGRGRGARTVEKMARHYLAEIRAVQPHGPYLLAGQCIGGLVARVITRHLLDDGEAVDLLVMYDSPHLGSPAYVREPFPTPRRMREDWLASRLWVGDIRRSFYRRLPTDDLVLRGSRAMTTAAWRHRPSELPPSVPTHYFHSGIERGRKIAMRGHWTDGAMGWADHQSPAFTVHRVPGDHNEMMYEPAAVAVLARLLEEHAARSAAPVAEATPPLTPRPPSTEDR